MNQVRIKYANKIVVNTGQGKEQMWIIIAIVKRGHGQGPEHFHNIVSALVPVLNLHRSFSYLSHSTFIPGLSDYFS